MADPGRIEARLLAELEGRDGTANGGLSHGSQELLQITATGGIRLEQEFCVRRLRYCPPMTIDDGHRLTEREITRLFCWIGSTTTVGAVSGAFWV